MKIKIFCMLVITVFLAAPSYAEKAPVKITPYQVISTNHDEIQIGDWVEFEAVNDVYLNDKLYVKKHTPIVGVVDFVHPNGWAKDNAEIAFKTFYTTDVNNKKVEISYPLNIRGEVLTDSYIKKITVQYLCGIIRGSEIYIEPDTMTFNIFITQ